LISFVIIKTVGENVKDTWDKAKTHTTTLKSAVQ
jgi:hypothetical protein